MQEIQINTQEIERLAELLEQTPDVIRSAKKEAIAAAAPKMKAIVDEEIGGSGRVKGWQGEYLGSLGFYAAVRPKAKTFAESRGLQTYSSKMPKTYAVGYVTNAITSGHYVRTRKTFAQERGYISGRVEGKHFYQRASARLGDVAQEAGENVCQAVISHLSNTGKTTSLSVVPHPGSVPAKLRAQQFNCSMGSRTFSFTFK